MRAALLSLLAVLAMSGCGGPPLAVAAKPDVDGCAGSWLRPTPANEVQVKAATLCLLNAQRARTGAGPLREDARLDLSAKRHSLDMVARKFFEHANPEGVQPAERMIHTGYPPIFVGENLGWGEEQEGTPAEMVRLWMESPGHKKNLLTPNFIDIGIGLAYGAPAPQNAPRPATTYTTDFGAGGR
jgi:uncharacterized protein YkwD